jgi:hypothetical protein
MQAPLNSSQKQQLWRHYQAQKPKKLDPHLKRDLKHGWLFLYLTVLKQKLSPNKA